MTTATLTISSKGQIVIPIHMREELGLKPGQRLNAEMKNGVIKLQRARTIDENATYFTSWIKPGTKPLYDVRKFIEENYHGERF
jgi:AbrB family looped-hinge helix DNA binding protein